MKHYHKDWQLYYLTNRDYVMINFMYVSTNHIDKHYKISDNIYSKFDGKGIHRVISRQQIKAILSEFL